MTITIQITNKAFIFNYPGNRSQLLNLSAAFNRISELYLDDARLKIRVETGGNYEIKTGRYVGKKISQVQIDYLISIISQRTKRRAYIEILCQWLQENSIPWEKI